MVLSAQQIMEIPQLLLIGGLCSCCAGSCRFSGAAVEKPLALPQLQLVEKSVVGLFWVMTSGNIPVFSAYWFDTGYMSTSVYGGLVSLVPRLCRQRQLVLLVSTHFAPCFLLCSQALMSYIMAGMDQKDFLVSPQLQFVKVVPFPVVTQRPFPVVQLVWPTTEVSQLQFALGGRCPWYAVVQVSFFLQLQFINVVIFTPVGAQCLSHGPDSCQTWESPVAVQGGRLPCFLVVQVHFPVVAQRLFPMVQTARRTIETSQLQYALDG